MNKVKVLIIDPWYIQYSEDMTNALSRITDLSLVTKYDISIIGNDISLHNFYFRFSNSMKRNLGRKLIRWIEYIIGWGRTIKLIHQNQFDVVHFQWLLQYHTDIFFLKQIKNYTKQKSIKLIYTAHNAIPHVNGEKSIHLLRKIYSLFNTIVVHGNNIGEDIKRLFPDVKNNIYIQKYGAILSKKKNSWIHEKKIKDEHLKKIKKCEGKILLLFGNIFYDKGFDRVMRYWCDKGRISDLLIIAGQIREKNKEYIEIENKIRNFDNVIYYTQSITNEEHDFFFSVCDVVILPYRKASMSSALFTAAQFCKPVMATKVGSIPEYINSHNAYLVDNDDKSIYTCLNKIVFNTEKEELIEKGIMFNNDIRNNFSWDKICEDLCRNVYIGKGANK